MREKVQTPLLYPCSHGVKIPEVGSDQTDIKYAPRAVSYSTSNGYSKQRKSPVNKNYLKQASAGLTFSEDVVRDRCFHMLPYDNKYLSEALDFSGLVVEPPKTRQPLNRCNQRGPDRRHMPCHLRKRVSHRLKPIKRKILEKAKDMRREGLKKEEAEMRNKSPMKDSDATSKSVFLTLTSPSQESVKTPVLESHGEDYKWDRYLISALSDTTARWLVRHRMAPGQNKEELEEFLEQRYGHVEEAEIELIKDNISEVDMPVQVAEQGSKWRKTEETLLDRVRDKVAGDERPTDPYSDESAAAFYRLPAGFRRAKKFVEKEHEGAINATAHNIEVVPYEAPPVNPLEDFVNPKAGSTVFKTDNMFEQEWLTGVKPIHQKQDIKDHIVMDSSNKYRKFFVKESPRKIETWYAPEDPKKKNKKGKNVMKKFERGLHRWEKLPEAIDTERVSAQMFEDDPKVIKRKNVEDDLEVLPPGNEGGHKSPDHTDKRKIISHNLLIQIINDWRNKWHLDMRYGDASPEDLIRDMADLHPHIRLKAITTCARAAEYKPPPELGIQLDESKDTSAVKLLPDEMFVALECCLDDEHEQVRRAAAVALYTLERPVEKAEAILRETLREEQSFDRWTAAQCLAYYGECDSEVVGELVYHLLNSDSAIRHEQASKLLQRLSENSTLVHSMIAEQLNSSSWRHRVMACTIIPKLNGAINKDLTQKLTHLMWNDWHSDVRKAAARTLGRTGHGKDVHDELRVKILNGNERQRVEAVSKIGHLGIMTAKLLPAFLECFQDNYVSVRMECCISCSNLKMNDPEILNRLLHLATYDPIWKVKALAIQAFGKIGTVTPDIRECILWAFRYEDQSGVRAEACHALSTLQIKGEDVAQALQDRYLVESSDIVKREIILGLKMLDILPTEDMDMVAKIKGEVRKLCTRGHICAQITVREEEERQRANLERMIFQPPGSQHLPHKDPESEVKSPQMRFSLVVPEEKGRPFSIIPYHLHTGPSSATSSADLPGKSASSEKSEGSQPFYSAERTALTPVADEEIQAILNRREPSALSGSMTSTPHPPEAEYFSDSTSQGQTEVKRKSRLSGSSPRLRESQSYVEVTTAEEQTASRDVVQVRHDSPSDKASESSDSSAEEATLNEDPPAKGQDAPLEKTSTEPSEATEDKKVETQPQSPEKKGSARSRVSARAERRLPENSLDATDLETAVSRYSVTD